VKFRTLLTINLLLPPTSCSSLLCLQKKNCRDDNSNHLRAGAPPTDPTCPSLLFPKVLPRRRQQLLHVHHLQRLRPPMVSLMCRNRPRPPHRQRALHPAFSAIAVRVLSMCFENAQANGHTLPLMMVATSVLRMLRTTFRTTLLLMRVFH
jgi:hypothetical protein